MNFSIGSLFDGSGGFPLAGTLCGMVPRWASEVEPYPIAVTRARFPDMKHLGDISRVNGAEIEPVDVITFGSPCQDLSVAGKQAGMKHESNGDSETTRSGLFMEAVRIIKEMRRATNGNYPKFAIWENVPGAFSSNKGEDFRTVLEEIVKVVDPSAPAVPAADQKGWPYADCLVGDGWSIAYRTFDAQHWGVPQRRRRIYLVADFTGGSAGKVLFEREGLRGYLAESGTSRQGAAAEATESTGANDREGEGRSGEVRGSDSLTYGVTTKGNGDAFLSEERHTALSGGGGQAGQGYPAAMVPFCKSARARTANDATTWKHATVANTLNTFDQGEARANELVVQSALPIHDQATRFSGKRGDKSDGKGNGLGIGQDGDPMNTLTNGDRHAVMYAVDRGEAAKAARQTFVVDFIGGQGEYGKESAVNPTLRAGAQGAVSYAIDQGGGKSSCSISVERAPTLTCTHDGAPAVAYGLNGTADSTDVVYALDQQGGKSGANYAESVMPTMCSDSHGTPHAVAYGINGEIAGTLDASYYKGCGMRQGTEREVVAEPHNYVVRRLTPTECARLQGFADRWGYIEQKDDLTDEEHRFWVEVRNTHAAINGKTVKDYTKAQILTWYNKLHSDSAEYKMWGNGIALPTTLYVMQGIADVLHERAAVGL